MLAILILYSVQFEGYQDISDKEKMYILVKGICMTLHRSDDSLIRGKLDGMLITILNIYAPPGSQWQFYKQMFDLMATETQGILIGGGDLNVRLNPKLDETGSNPIRNKSLIWK